ncbi:hypothetical protein, partial [Alkalihalobacillus trypoxylicola]|uniref:hypothetical protein n=1 Tax=Alkalihalobacillus trypoxylicola TaxID=519424 RepID=UPI001C3F8860
MRLGNWSKESLLFARTGSRTTKTVKRESTIHPKRAQNQKNGQKGAVYSPEKSMRLGNWSKEKRYS